MSSEIKVSDCGWYISIHMGSVIIEFTKDQIDRFGKWVEGGKVTLVMLDHLIDRKEVEVLHVLGQDYTKTDILQWIMGNPHLAKDPNAAIDPRNI